MEDKHSESEAGEVGDGRETIYSRYVTIDLDE